MNVYWFEANGRIVQAGFNVKEADLEGNALTGFYEHVVLEDTVMNISDYFVSAGQLVAKPAQPSKDHRFDYQAKTWVDPRTEQQKLDQAWAQVRQQRDALLRTTDWRALRAMEQGVPLEPVWVEYRQALRDITNQLDPLAIAWPAPVEQ